MNALHPDSDRALARWLEEEAAAPAPAGAYEALVEATSRRRPRPAWIAAIGGQWVRLEPIGGADLRAGPSHTRLRPSTVVVLGLLAAALAAGAIVVGAQLLQQRTSPLAEPGRLAYEGSDGMYLADWDGSHPIGITRHDSECQSSGEGAIWSPDGGHLLVPFGCDSELDVDDAVGRRIGSVPSGSRGADWSPDSTRIATWNDLASLRIGIFGRNGERQKDLFLNDCPEAGAFDPRWSPDAASLVVGPCEIHLDGRPAVRLAASDPRSDFGWSYSANGTAAGRRLDGKLILTKPDGAQTELVSSGVASDPVWSPTGDRIAFLRRNANVDPPHVDLDLVDAASGAITTLRKIEWTGLDYALAFAPAGDRILFQDTDHPNPRSLFVMNVDGTGVRRLVTGIGRAEWQPVPGGP
jgi:hypothetical protein